jgi:hypothetical protein
MHRKIYLCICVEIFSLNPEMLFLNYDCFCQSIIHKSTNVHPCQEYMRVPLFPYTFINALNETKAKKLIDVDIYMPSLFYQLWCLLCELPEYVWFLPHFPSSYLLLNLHLSVFSLKLFVTFMLPDPMGIFQFLPHLDPE